MTGLKCIHLTVLRLLLCPLKEYHCLWSAYIQDITFMISTLPLQQESAAMRLRGEGAKACLGYILVIQPLFLERSFQRNIFLQNSDFLNETTAG